MTRIGIIYLVSALYLSGVICLSFSIHENDQPGWIARETLRRWLKFLGLTLIIAIVVTLLD